MIRLICDPAPIDPRFGLALDEALFERARMAGANTVRVWVNARAVVIGRSQAIAAEVDLEAADRLKIPVLRRISGGGAVYHHPGNLNLSLCLSDAGRLGGVNQAFHRIGKAIADGLSSVGIRVNPVENRLIVGGRKVGGAAQARRGKALLYHTTLIVRPDSIPMERLLCALRPGYRTPAVPSHPFPTASLSEIIGEEVPLEQVGVAAAVGIARTCGSEPRDGVVTQDEIRRAEELVREKYGTERWNRQH